MRILKTGLDFEDSRAEARSTAREMLSA